MNTLSSTLTVFAAGLLCAAVPAAAQTVATRPYNGAFGGAAPDPKVHESLESMLSVAEGYDDNVLGNGLTASGSPLQQSGAYTHLSGTIFYTHLGKTVQFGASGQSSTRYYGQEGTFLGASHAGAVSLNALMGRRARVQASQSVSYSPSYLYGVFPTLGPAADIDFGEALTNEHALVSESTAEARFEVWMSVISATTWRVWDLRTENRAAATAMKMSITVARPNASHALRDAEELRPRTWLRMRARNSVVGW